LTHLEKAYIDLHGAEGTFNGRLTTAIPPI
jgi:hypothetical protein